MPCLICDLRPEALVLFDEYRALQDAGEAIALFCPAAAANAAQAVAGADALHACFDDEQIALLSGGVLPAWLPLDEFHRVLLIAGPAELSPAERALGQLLLARGAEEVEVLPPAAITDFAQSWASGRRTGGVILR